LLGFSLPEPFFQPKIKETIGKMMTVLKDPSLPLLELQAVISSSSGRMAYPCFGRKENPQAHGSLR
jgi:hypothetical protein